MPAAGTQMLTAPCLAITWPNTFDRNSESAASPMYACATGRRTLSLIAPATSVAFALRSTIATALTPRRASSKATASPMPLAAPVTKATLASIFIVFSFLRAIGSGGSRGIRSLCFLLPVRAEEAVSRGCRVLSSLALKTLHHQFRPLHHRRLEVAHLGLVGLAHAVDGLLPQLDGLGTQLFRFLGLGEMERLLDVLQAGTELGLQRFALFLDEVGDKFGPFLLGLLDLVASARRAYRHARPDAHPLLEKLLLQVDTGFRR